MALVGQRLPQPEAGWKRYEDTDVNIEYIGDWYKNQSYDTITSTVGDISRFNFYGKKIRIMVFSYFNRSNMSISIDDAEPVTIKGYHNVNSVSANTLAYEILDLPMKEHSVVITNIGGGVYATIDAIDVDVDGELLPYNKIFSKYLVQDSEKVKKPVMDGLQEIGDVPVTVGMFEDHGTEDLSDIIGIVNKDVTMVYRQDLEGKKVEGYKLVGYPDISSLTISENLVLVKESDKYFTFKNGEFIEVELSQESFTDKSVILSQLTTPTKIVGMTMEESRVLGEGKEFKKTINMVELKAKYGLIEKMSEA